MIYAIQYDVDVSREKGNMTAVMSGHKMLGQYLSMWKDALEIKDGPSDSEHHRNFAIFALAGANGNRPLARQIFRGFMLKLGSDAVFDGGGSGFTDEAIDTLLNEAAGH